MIMGFRLSFTKQLLWYCFVAFAHSITVIPAQADLIERMTEDFRPLSGYIVKSVGNEFIIDLDQSHGISKGDLFSVVAIGEAVVHPVTGKVLGSLEEAKGILQVTRLKQGYSYARLLEKGAEIKPGDPIRRFENLPAIIWDYAGDGRVFSDQLQSALPGLEWRDYDSAQLTKPEAPLLPPGQSTAIYFILTDSGIEVRGPKFVVLRKYDLPQSLSADGKTSAIVKRSLQPPTPVPEEKKDMGYSAVFKAAQTIGNLPGVTLMADFVEFDDQLLLATTDGSEIYIFEVTDNLRLITNGDTPVPAQILALNWWIPVKGNPPYLAVVAWNDGNVVSTIFKFYGGRLTPMKGNLPRILGTFDLNGDGRPETLLGQTFDSEDFFGTNIRKFFFKDDKIKSERSPIYLPRRFTVLGSQIADLTGDGKLESVFVRSGILYIYLGKKQLHASQKEMGGTISVLTYEKDLLTKYIMTQTAAFEISPVATDFDGDGRLELLVVSSDKKFFTAPGISPNVKNTRLAVLKYQDGRFVKGTIGEKIERPIQGLTVSDERLLFVISEPGSIFGKEGSSHLLGYPLAKR
jgi:hypothetical protein